MSPQRSSLSGIYHKHFIASNTFATNKMAHSNETDVCSSLVPFGVCSNFVLFHYSSEHSHINFVLKNTYHCSYSCFPFCSFSLCSFSTSYKNVFDVSRSTVFLHPLCLCVSCSTVLAQKRITSYHCVFAPSRFLLSFFTFSTCKY